MACPPRRARAWLVPSVVRERNTTARLFGDGLLCFSPPSETRSASHKQPISQFAIQTSVQYRLARGLNIVSNNPHLAPTRLGVEEGVAGTRVDVARLTDRAEVDQKQRVGRKKQYTVLRPTRLAAGHVGNGISWRDGCDRRSSLFYNEA